MTDKIKAFFNSEKAMKAVNLFFILSLLFRGHGIIFIAYIIWIIYLSYHIKRTTSKTVRIFNGIFIVFAAVMIVVNLYFLLPA